jgi:hypothetical protein
VLDLVEEPLDLIPGSIEIRAEADRIVAIRARWNVGPRAFLGCKRSDPVRIIAAVGEQHRSRLQTRQELSGEAVVVCLTGRQREPNRQAIGIDQRSRRSPTKSRKLRIRDHRPASRLSWCSSARSDGSSSEHKARLRLLLAHRVVSEMSGFAPLLGEKQTSNAPIRAPTL